MLKQKPYYQAKFLLFPIFCAILKFLTSSIVPANPATAKVLLFLLDRFFMQISMNVKTKVGH